MELAHYARDTSAGELSLALRESGALVVEEFLSEAVHEQLQRDFDAALAE